MIINNIIKRFTTTQQRVAIKKKKRHLISFFKRQKKVSLEEMKRLLMEQLNITAGDKIIVSSSFGNLNAAFSPKELIVLLQEIVGEDGVIMMPYYPPMNSNEWVKGNHVFDMRTTVSGMGVLTNVFSKMPGVRMSCHPIKAVCVWGKPDVIEDIIKDHDKALTPFYKDSPYGRLLEMGSKSLCLGLNNIPIFHAVEDFIAHGPHSFYKSTKQEIPLYNLKGEKMLIATYIHDDNEISKCIAPRDYATQIPLSSYRKVKCGYKYCVSVSNTELLSVTREEYSKGNTLQTVRKRKVWKRK